MALPDYYNSSQWKLSFAGLFISGFNTGPHIKVTWDTDLTTFAPGADGNGTFVVSNQKSGSVEITLRRNAPINIALGLKLNAYLTGDFAGGSGPLFLENITTGATISSPLATIKKQPDVEAGTDASPVVWMFTCGKLSQVVGGIAL